METNKTTTRHGVEIQFSTINPLEMWKKLGLEQKIESAVMAPQEFDSEELKQAYEVFKNDFKGEEQRGIAVISSEKGSIFVWSLLKAESRRSPLPKLSSKKFLFKDKLFQGICKKAESCKGITFSEKDFEDVVLYLESKRLVKTSIDGIRTTQHFADLFHRCYGAWLVF